MLVRVEKLEVTHGLQPCPECGCPAPHSPLAEVKKRDWQGDRAADIQVAREAMGMNKGRRR